MKLRTPDASATSRQLWYLHILTKTDTRGLRITMAEASQWITIYQAGKVSTIIQKASPKPQTVAVTPTKPKAKTSRPKSSTKVAPKSNGFTCWYCLDGHKHEYHEINRLQTWTLCLGCGATTVNLPNYKMKRNKLGGAAGINFGKR